MQLYSHTHIISITSYCSIRLPLVSAVARITRSTDMLSGRQFVKHKGNFLTYFCGSNMLDSMKHCVAIGGAA